MIASDPLEVSLSTHFALAFQFSLGLVFLLSVLPKLRRPLAFAESVVAYQILPARVAYLFGLVLILGEAFLAVAFLANWLTAVALPLATGLLVVFLVAVGINLRRGRRITCGCFGNASEQISRRTVARLLLLLAVVLLLMVFHGVGETPLPRLESMDTSVVSYLLQTVLLAVSLLLLGTWMLNLPDLILLVRHGRGNRPAVGSTPGVDGMEDVST